MLKKIAVTSAIAAGLVLSVPFAANAAGYVAEEDISVSGSATAGGTVVVAFEEGAFIGGAPVSITVTGDTAVTLAAVTTGPITKNAAADGSVDVSITLPANASGAYEVVATDGVSTGTAAFALAPAAGGGAGTGTGTGSTGGSATGTGSTSGNGLASTGQDLPLTAMFVGGGALVLGGVVLGTVYTTRRRGVARQN